MKELNDNNFREEIKKEKLALVDFYATWCGPCGMQADVLKRMSESRTLDFSIVKVNVDEAPGLALEHSISSIPTLVVYKEGKMVKKVVGLSDEEEILNIMSEFMD